MCCGDAQCLRDQRRATSSIVVCVSGLLGDQHAKGTFKVWTKRTGNSPTMKVLVGHGGLGATHEYMEAFDSDFPAYDQKVYFDGVVKFVRDVDQGRL